jgi:hypothetical protein
MKLFWKVIVFVKDSNLNSEAYKLGHVSRLHNWMKHCIKEKQKTHRYCGTSNLQAMTIPIHGQCCQAWGKNI